MPESPATPLPLNLTLHPDTHGHLASVTLGLHPVNYQRSFTVECDEHGATETLLVGLLNAPMDLAGTAGVHRLVIHLEQLGSNSTIFIGDQPLRDFYLKLFQRYDQDLWLEFSGMLGSDQLDYAGPFTLDPTE
jgi:hypothetical protein